MGASLSSIFLIYTGQSIVQVFFVTAAAFARSQPLWLHDQEGSIRVGIVPHHGSDWDHRCWQLVNIFLQSSALQFAISVIGVLVFAGLTAYDTQRIKDGYYEVAGNAELAAKTAIMGALSLYLDFINMFMMLLQLFGNRE